MINQFQLIDKFLDILLFARSVDVVNNNIGQKQYDHDQVPKSCTLTN